MHNVFGLVLYCSTVRPQHVHINLSSHSVTNLADQNVFFLINTKHKVTLHKPDHLFPDQNIGSLVLFCFVWNRFLVNIVHLEQVPCHYWDRIMSI